MKLLVRPVLFLAPGFLMLLGFLLLMKPATAHHSHASLDREDIRTFSGVVTKYGWTMPHVYLKVDAPNQDGTIVNYTIELANPPSMARRGWSKQTFKPGDRITWEGAHDRNKSRPYTGLKWAEHADGTRVAAVDNVELEIQPSADFSGLWKRDLRGGKSHYYPPEGWPYNPTGQSLVDNFVETQNPQTDCQDPGPPKYMLLPYAIQFSRPDNKTIIMHGELRELARTIYLDRERAPGDPSAMGHSVGWFEGDELVVETSNFIADRWGSYTGVDSSAQKHLVERFSLSANGMALDALITITDPVYLAEPVIFEHHWLKLADRELVYAPCTLESTRLYYSAGYEEE